MSDDDDVDILESEDDELEQVSHLVPKRLKELAQRNSDFGDMSEAVRDVYRLAAHGANVGERRMRHELRRIRQEREHLKARIESIESEVRQLGRAETRLEEQLEEVRDHDEAFERRMERVEADIREGMSVFIGHGEIEELATMGSMSQSAVIERLKDRNPDLPPEAFMERRHADREWRGEETFRATGGDE